jgi:hypothetical protein
MASRDGVYVDRGYPRGKVLPRYVIIPKEPWAALRVALTDQWLACAHPGMSTS